MPVELQNPPGLPISDAYAQMSIATGTRIVFISGQVARTANGAAVGDADLAAQAEQAFHNVHTAITAAGGTFADIARLNIYVVDWVPEKFPQLVEGAMRAAQQAGIELGRPVTLIGVAALAEPDLMVEVEAVAVLS